MIKITESEERLTPAKKNIKLDGIFVKDLKFVDETGDITEQVVNALPEGTEQVGFKITVELPSENEYEDKKYLGTDGYVLFHEAVNSKALIDMQNNQNIEMSGYDWFIIAESKKQSKTNNKHDNTNSKVCNVMLDNNNSTYNVTIKSNLNMDDIEKIMENMECRMIHILDKMNLFKRL